MPEPESESSDSKPSDPAAPEDEILFSDLGLKPELLRAIEEQGYERPTPIQAGAIPPLLEGRDLLGQAQTGTGKTAAFALPLLHRLKPDVKHVQAMVLTPTRELALQVAEAVRAYGKHLGSHGVHVLPVYGGAPIHVQLNALRRGVDVVIGTPGRVKDHLERGSLDLGQISFFGLDEADEMLKMGFIDDVEWILEHAPDERQIALFSATMPGPIRRVADRHLRNVADVTVSRRALTVPQIEQLGLRIGGYKQKNEALERILEAEEFEAVLIFCRTKRGCGELAEYLEARGHHAEAVHGDLTQSQREAVVRRLRGRVTQIVIATDVAARGLDVDHISLVINYDIPNDEEVYVHRIGRTGRAGRKGRSITFWQPRERRLLQSIERLTGQRMQNMRVPGPAELHALRRERFVEKLRNKALKPLEEFKALARELATEEGLDLEQVAAAALRQAWGEDTLAPPTPVVKAEPHRSSEDGSEIEIVIPVGRTDRVRPGDIVGAIAGETGLPGKVVGSIRILERVSFVSVKAAHIEQIMAALETTKIRGLDIEPRLAHPDEGGKAQGKGAKPFGKGGKKPFGKGGKKPYDRGGKKPFGKGGKKPFGKGGKKPFGKPKPHRKGSKPAEGEPTS